MTGQLSEDIRAVSAELQTMFGTLVSIANKMELSILVSFEMLILFEIGRRETQVTVNFGISSAAKLKSNTHRRAALSDLLS